jgi:hypothetical protein
MAAVEQPGSLFIAGDGLSGSTPLSLSTIIVTSYDSPANGEPCSSSTQGVLPSAPAKHKGEMQMSSTRYGSMLFVGFTLALLSATSGFAYRQIPNIRQERIALVNSNVPAPAVLKILQKRCANVTITSDKTASDYTLDVTKSSEALPNQVLKGTTFSLTVVDRSGKIFNTNTVGSLGTAVTDMCQVHGWVDQHSIRIEVVDTSNLTQSQDLRNTPGVGVAGSIVNATTGRTTHTDASWMKVIINNEHAWMDCYERRKGCSTIAPGQYFGKLDGGDIWVNTIMPITHRLVRNHYKIVGGW